MPRISKEQRVRFLQEEIMLAKRLNDEHIKGQMEEALARYTGEHTPFLGQNWDVNLNEIYPVIQFNLPSIFFRNPRVFIKPRNKTFIARRRDPITGGFNRVFLDASKSARTQEHILNFILSEIRYKQEVQKVLFDALLFRHGILWHGYKGDFGMTEEKSIFIRSEQVFVKRVSPMRFYKDPAVGMYNLEEARWVARSFDVPLDDLAEDPSIKLDKKVKGRLGFGDKITNPKSGLGGIDILRPHARSLIDFSNEEFKRSTRARFVEVIEVFVRPTPSEKRDNEKGQVVLLTPEQDSALRTNPWPYKVEGWPCELLEFNPLPDRQFGLSDIDTYKEVADQKNAIINIQLRNAQENSKVWVVYAKDAGFGEEDLDMIQRGDQTIIGFPGDTVQNKFALFSPSGNASSELFIVDQRIQKSLEDKSGVTDLKRGFLQSGEESAASVKLRAAGGSVRPAYRQDIMSDFLQASMTKLNGYNKQFFTIDKAVRIVGSLDIEWSDEPNKEEIQAETDIELDVTSMLPENPEREIQELQTVLQLMVQGLADPAIRAKLEEEGRKINLTPLIEKLLMRLKIRDPEIFRAITEEESEGTVSVREIRNAKENVQAALAGQEIPHPPEPGQDHRAHIETYKTILAVIQELGNTPASQVLQELIQAHTVLLQEELKKESPRPGQAVRSGTGRPGGRPPGGDLASAAFLGVAPTNGFQGAT